MPLFVLTGTPGTGKSTLADNLGARGYLVVRINDIVNEHGLWTGKENGSKVVSMSKLRNKLLGIIKKSKGRDIVIEGHIACEFSLPADFCIVLRTDPALLLRRMSGRKYRKKKISGNLEAEILDYCTQLSERNYSCPVYEIDTSFSISKSLRDLDKVLEFGRNPRKNRKSLEKFKPGGISWSDRNLEKTLYS